jgi:beta-phosphoglucomutase
MPIIFDFDGVLVDTEPLHEEALRAAARELGMHFSSERYWSAYIGMDDRDTLALIAADNGRELSDKGIRQLARAKWQAMQKIIAAGRVAPYAGALELLEAARRASHIAICSGARRREIDCILAKLAVPSVPVLVSADDVGRSKPDPESYTLTVKKLADVPRQCVAIEDTVRGVQSAKAAGCRVVAVGHTLPVDTLAAAGADAVLPRIGDLRLDQLLAMTTAGTSSIRS